MSANEAFALYFILGIPFAGFYHSLIMSRKNTRNEAWRWYQNLKKIGANNVLYFAWFFFVLCWPIGVIDLIQSTIRWLWSMIPRWEKIDDDGSSGH